VRVAQSGSAGSARRARPAPGSRGGRLGERSGGGRAVRSCDATSSSSCWITLSSRRTSLGRCGLHGIASGGARKASGSTTAGAWSGSSGRVRGERHTRGVRARPVQSGFLEHPRAGGGRHRVRRPSNRGPAQSHLARRDRVREARQRLFALAGRLARLGRDRQGGEGGQAVAKIVTAASRAIDENPAQVHEQMRQRPDVPRGDLEEFRRLLHLP